MRPLGQHGSRQRKVVRVGDLEILCPAGHQPGVKAHGLHGAGFIGHVGAHLVNRLHQRADAEHLGRLRQPLVAAVHGRSHAHTAWAVDGGLERVGQLVRQQPAHTVARALVDERIDLL